MEYKLTCIFSEDEEGGVQQQQQEQQQLLQADDSQRRIQIEALDNEIEYNETLISEREGEIQGIEQGITELNEIFRDLGMLVNEQESGIRKFIYNIKKKMTSNSFLLQRASMEMF